MALASALLTQAGVTGAGYLADRYLNQDPAIPDFSAEAQAEFARRRQELNDMFGQRRGDIEAGLSAAGRTGSAGASSRRELYGKTAESFADLAAKEASAVRRAEDQEERLRFRREQAESDARSQAISDLVGVAGGALAERQLGDEEEQTEPSEEGSPGSNFDISRYLSDEYTSAKYGIPASHVKGGR